MKKRYLTSTLAALALSLPLYAYHTYFQITKNNTPAKTNSVEIESSIIVQDKDFGIMTVHYIDVGQGDSEFIELPNGESMLIDAGVQEQAQTVITYIQQQGYNELDYVVCTHPHSDHIGGMAEVIDNFKADNVYISPAPHTTYTYESLLDSIENSGAQCFKGTADMTITYSESFSAEIVAPTAGYNYGDNLNNASVVVKITNGNNSFLFTGDAEYEEMKTPQNVDCDVLKLGHHGSGNATNKYVLSQTTPQYAVISVGANNQYGHPHDNVIKLLEENGIEIFRTDIHGSITAISDGTNISFDFE